MATGRRNCRTVGHEGLGHMLVICGRGINYIPCKTRINEEFDLE